MPSIELGNGYIPENKTKKDRVQKEQVTRVNPRPENQSKSNDIRIKQGNFAWSLLHKYTGCDPQWFELWQYFIPNRCDCKAGYQKILESLPPDFSSPDAFFAWGVELHNAVNKKIERQEMQIDQAKANWRNIRPQSGKTKAVVTVATGREFLDLLDVTGPTIKAYAARCDADYIALTNATTSWWGLEKFRTRHFVEQYDEVLFVDADCIVHPDAPSLFGQDCDVLIHNDAPYLESLAWLKSERREVCEAISMQYDDANLCLNSGVVYTRKAASGVWSEPPSNIPTSHCAEQIVVEQQAIRHGYRDLDSRFNWQFYFKDFYAGLDDAYIIHLATCSNKLETARQLLT